MTVIDKDKLQSFGEGLFAKIKSRFVDKTGENIIAGKTTILNGYIPGGVITSFNHKNKMQVGEGIGHYCGSPHRSIPANRHISHIVFAVKDGYSVGEVIDGVNIGVVRKDNNQVIEILKNNAKYPVLKNEHQGITANKVIVVDIDKVYGEEVYIIFGAKGFLWIHTGQDDELIDCAGGNTLPRVGDILGVSSGNYIGSFEIYDNGIALRDLANSGTSGVTREEFTQHVTTNEQQHQALNSSISNNTQSIKTANQNISSNSQRIDTANQNILANTQSITVANQNISSNTQQIATANQNISTNTQNIAAANQNISSNSQRISSLDGNAAKKGSPNTFTSQNTFQNNSPVVQKYFPIKTITADGIDGLHTAATYCCNPKQGIQNSFVSGLVVPVHNSQPGDTIQASYFTVNASTLRTTSGVLGEKTYTVQDIIYKGHYCIVIDVNNTFNYAVSFGFGMKDVLIGTRRVGLLKTDLPNSGNVAWGSYSRPANNDSVSHLSGKFVIPYMITKKATSELVTRFDLANNTIPLSMYQIGELKAFAIDLGKSTTIGNKIWIRCEGQIVNQDKGSNVLTVATQDTTSPDSITLPVSEAGKYVYVCAYEVENIESDESLLC